MCTQFIIQRVSTPLPILTTARHSARFMGQKVVRVCLFPGFDCVFSYLACRTAIYVLFIHQFIKDLAKYFQFVCYSSQKRQTPKLTSHVERRNTILDLLWLFLSQSGAEVKSGL